MLDLNDPRCSSQLIRRPLSLNLDQMSYHKCYLFVQTVHLKGDDSLALLCTGPETVTKPVPVLDLQMCSLQPCINITPIFKSLGVLSRA